METGFQCGLSSTDFLHWGALRLFELLRRALKGGNRGVTVGRDVLDCRRGDLWLDVVSWSHRRLWLFWGRKPRQHVRCRVRQYLVVASAYSCAATPRYIRRNCV